VTSYRELIPHAKCQPFHDHFLLLLPCVVPSRIPPLQHSIFSQLQQLGVLGFLYFNNKVLNDWLHVEQHYSTLLRATLSNPNVVARFEYVDSQETL
jgi:hypothetical protein